MYVNSGMTREKNRRGKFPDRLSLISAIASQLTHDVLFPSGEGLCAVQDMTTYFIFLLDKPQSFSHDEGHAK